MKDLILVTGVISVGKTEAVRFCMEYLERLNIPYQKKAFTDAQCILEVVKKDDCQGGFHHTHEWLKSNKTGHSHRQNPQITPFISLDNHIPQKMLQLFFQGLVKLNKTDKIWFVEWAGGENTYPDKHLLKRVDFSYTMVFSLLNSKLNPEQWSHRVKAIIHISARQKTRKMLNEKDQCFINMRNNKGIYKWRRSSKTFSIFGKDDFLNSGLGDLFAKDGVLIFEVLNEGTGKFYDNLEQVMNQIFMNRN